MRYKIILFLLFLNAPFCFSQKPEVVTAANIHEDIQKLNFLGSVLYLAAHPDDENNRMITYLSNHVKAKTTYLSLTRGDGGQNIIGAEIRELLGVIRTHEMLEARKIDGGNQLFSRANDFGYSKTPDETFTIWNKEEVLHDVVWAIRKLQPDIIINRFDHRTPGTTHGHHTASAILSKEAFSIAADEKVFPEQLKHVDTYRPKRLFYNVLSHYKSFQEFDKSKYYPIDIGTYYPLKGKSNNEIAAEARSRHQCQGMGTTASRGSKIEYMEYLDGSIPGDKNDIFSNINTTWSRLAGGAAIGDILAKVEEGFNYRNPAASIPDLIKAHQLIEQLKDGYWKTEKKAAIEKIILNCAGLYMEATTNEGKFVIGEMMNVNFEAINRSEAQVQLKSVKITSSDYDSLFRIDLLSNEPLIFNQSIQLNNSLRNSNAYWLNQKSSLGMYKVEDLNLLGLAETSRELRAIFNLNINGQAFSYKTDLIQKFTDPVKGEVYQPLEITPPVFVNIPESVYLFPDHEAKEIEIKITAGKANISGTLKLGQGEGWTVLPNQIEFNLQQKGEEQVFKFMLTPPDAQSESFIEPSITIGNQTYNQSINEINYPHISRQVVLLPAKAKIVKVDLKTVPLKIAYIEGTGDAVPDCLEQIGYAVNILDDSQLTTAQMESYDVVVVGIRAYNVREKLKFQHEQLMDYVKKGGTVIVQYNTNHRLLIDNPAPLPLSPSRDRVTVEQAEVLILQADHPLMNFPNGIDNKDFDNWVQERGLYFPNKWDERYVPILSSHDPGESAKKGGMLYTKYVEGHFIYTGFSWFRQLPAGVPGAYRIFANMLAVGKYPRP